MSSLSTFLSIPVELAERILTISNPCDVACFSMTCHAAYNIVHRSPDQDLWRQLFLLHPFDDPRRSFSFQHHLHEKDPLPIDWQSELLRRLKAKTIALSQPPLIYERKRALETFISMVQDALPAKLTKEYEPSYNLIWLHDVLKKSRILDSPPLLNEARHYARLRSYLALTLDTGKDEKTQLRLRERRIKSRSFVYDLRNYHSENSWGPFIPLGRINWIHVEHLINVVLMNLRDLPGMWAHTKPPLGLQATRPYSAPGVRSPIDWAGIEGTWRRYVCFMDYRDLFTFNYTNVNQGTHDPVIFQDPRFREATRLIEVKLRIISKQSLRYRLQPLVDRWVSLDPQYPPLYFSGCAKGVQGSEAVVEGMVRMGVDGVPRWQFVSVYDGFMQWSSDGVQLGNVGSAMGVVGVWSTAVRDQGDPVGPFWLWKVEDDETTHLMEYT